MGDDVDPSTAEGDRREAPEPPLAELRLRIRALASTDGRFVVACARRGESPVPIDGYRFESRAVAAEAATYVAEYREQLRELDPRTPRYDPVVHEVDACDASNGLEPAVLREAGAIEGDSDETGRRSTGRGR